MKEFISTRKTLEANLDPDQRLLWEFATRIYPPRDTREKEVTEGSIIEEANRDAVHDSRWEISRFFQRNAKSIGNQRPYALNLIIFSYGLLCASY